MTHSSVTFTPEEIDTYYAARVPGLKRRADKEWRGPCPVHHGTDDNFSVNSITGLGSCHSRCGRGGDILDLEEALVGGDFFTRKAEVFRVVGRIESKYPVCGVRTNGNSAGGGAYKTYQIHWRDGQMARG